MDFVQPKFVDRVIEAMSVHPECSEGQNTREQASISSFQKPTHFKPSVNDSTGTTVLSIIIKQGR